MVSLGVLRQRRTRARPVVQRRLRRRVRLVVVGGVPRGRRRQAHRHRRRRHVHHRRVGSVRRPRHVAVARQDMAQVEADAVRWRMRKHRRRRVRHQQRPADRADRMVAVGDVRAQTRKGQARSGAVRPRRQLKSNRIGIHTKVTSVHNENM